MGSVLITGAAHGIGAATARRFAESGHAVALHCATNREAAQAVLGDLPGSGHAVLRADLSTPGAPRTLVDQAVAALGRIDVLVCNAAVGPSAGNRHRVEEASPELWDRVWHEMVTVNLLAPAALAHAAAGHMIARGGGGAIVNVGSRGALKGEPEYPAYGATKAGLHSLGQSLAVALAPHDISVATVAPGFVETPRQAGKLAGAEGDALRSQSPFGRVASASEIAGMIVWLASSEAKWCSGAVLDANGASYLH